MAEAEAALLEQGLVIQDVNIFRGCKMCILDSLASEDDEGNSTHMAKGSALENGGRASSAVSTSGVSDAQEELMEGCREAAAAAMQSSSEVIKYRRTALELIVQAHGGEVLQRSEGISKGLTHVLWLSNGSCMASGDDVAGLRLDDGGNHRVNQTPRISPDSVLDALYAASLRGCKGDVAKARRIVSWIRTRLTAGSQWLGESSAADVTRGDWPLGSEAVGGGTGAGTGAHSTPKGLKPVYLVDSRYVGSSSRGRHNPEARFGENLMYTRVVFGAALFGG